MKLMEPHHHKSQIHQEVDQEHGCHGDGTPSVCQHPVGALSCARGRGQLDNKAGCDLETLGTPCADRGRCNASRESLPTPAVVMTDHGRTVKMIINRWQPVKVTSTKQTPSMAGFCAEQGCTDPREAYSQGGSVWGIGESPEGPQPAALVSRLPRGSTATKLTSTASNSSLRKAQGLEDKAEHRADQHCLIHKQALRSGLQGQGGGQSRPALPHTQALHCAQGSGEMAKGRADQHCLKTQALHSVLRGEG